MWINNDKKIFGDVCSEIKDLFLLWVILINIIIEKDVVIRDIKNKIDIDIKFQWIILDIKKISLIVLIVGGAEMLTAMNINHQKVMLGIIEINPLNIKIFRVWNFIYKSFTKRKRAEDDNPWAIIIIIAPEKPIRLLENNPNNTNPICATDEYAIKDLRSFWRIQFILVAVAPIKLILIIIGLIIFIFLIQIGKNRINPYPPSFSKMAARIIDPSRGASTWALGNHRWVKYIGIFTKNAIINIIIMLYLYIRMYDIVNDGFFKKIILINNGSDAVIV